MKKKLDCDKSMKKMRLLVRQWKRMTVGILRELHLVKEYLTSQKNQCKDPAAPNYLGSSSWKGYCHEIGLPPQTADAWLRRCDFLGLPAAQPAPKTGKAQNTRKGKNKEARMKKTAITPQEAKTITLEIWEYLAAHPEVQFKQGLPKRLFAKIKDLNQACPLCELYNGPGPGCPGCPLGNCNYPSPFGKWCSPEVQDKDREAAAQEIVEKIRAWEPGKKPRSAKGRQGGKA